MPDKKLQEIRRRIDDMDRKLVDIIAERLKLSDDIVALKSRLKVGVRDDARERVIIDRTRALARDRGIEPALVESIMRLVMAQMAGEERDRMGGSEMWKGVQRIFGDHPAQMSVARIMFRYGLRVRDDGEIACGDIRIPAVQIAREAGVDRRVVDSAAQRILKDEKLREVFENLEPIAYLKGVAQKLGMGVIEILPEDAAEPGILKGVTGVISRFGVSIRQAVADDPIFVPQPKLTLITDEPVTGGVIEALCKLPSVRSVIVY